MSMGQLVFQFMDLQRIFRFEVEISPETIDENTNFIMELFQTLEWRNLNEILVDNYSNYEFDG